MGVTTHPIIISPRRRRLYGLIAASGLFAALTSIIVPLPALILAIAAILLLITDHAFGPLGNLGPKSQSQSIVGTRAITRGNNQSPREPRWRVVLLAPLDAPVVTSGLTGLAGPSYLAAQLRIGALVLVALAILIDLLWPQRGWVLLVLPITIMLTLQIAASLREPNLSPHDDTIGGLTALLLATNRMHDLERVEIWAMAVGATTLDPGGIEDLLRAYPFERERTLAIVIDRIDNGPISYYARGSDQELHQIVTTAAASLKLNITSSPHRDRASLAKQLHHRSMRVIALASSAIPDNVPGPRRSAAQQIESGTRLIMAMVEQLEDGR